MSMLCVPNPALKCGTKVQNGTNKLKLGFPAPKYKSVHLGMNFRKACTLSGERYQNQQIGNAK